MVTRPTTRRSPVGFTKLTLGRWRGWTLRLHIWHGHGSEWPHNHRWAFTSLPLLGRYEDTRWAVMAGDTHRRLTARRPALGVPHRYEDTGVIEGLRAYAVHTRRPLRAYRCSAGVVHSVRRVGRGPHVTVVLHGPAQRESTSVWQPAGGGS